MKSGPIPPVSKTLGTLCRGGRGTSRYHSPLTSNPQLSTISSVVTLAGGNVCINLPPLAGPTVPATGRTAFRCTKSLWSCTSLLISTVPFTLAIVPARTAISVTIARSRCGFTTDNVKFFPFIEADPLSPASVFTAFSDPR